MKAIIVAAGLSGRLRPLNNEIVLGPGDSFIILPNTLHAFRNVRKGELVVVDFKPSTGNPLEELASIARYAGKEALKRVHTETLRWF